MTQHVKQWARTLSTSLAGVMVWSAWALAQQPPATDVKVTTTTTEMWYGQWWVWAVGVAVFLIIVIALTNRGGRGSGA